MIRWNKASAFGFLFVALITSCCASAPAVRPTLTPAGIETLRSTLATFSERDGFAGGVALVEQGGEVVLYDGLGPKLTWDSVSVRQDSIWPIHSMTKPIVSVAVLQLVEEGRLGLEDPIGRYLPEFASPEVCLFGERGVLTGTRPARTAITIADLLGHTSGLCYGLFELGELKPVYEAANLDREFESNRELALAIAELPLAFDPGTEWRYGRSTDVLGALLEEVEGESLQSILSRRIFEPLRMEDTAFFVPQEKWERLHPRIVSSTLGSAEAVQIALPGVAVYTEPQACGAGGGLYSTAADYLCFCRMLLADGMGEQGRVLDAESVRLLTSDRLEGLPRARLLGTRGFGLGVAVLTAESAGPLNGSVGSFHWSGIAGTSFFVDPECELIGVFMTNRFRDFSYMTEFRKGVYAALHPPVGAESSHSGSDVGE